MIAQLDTLINLYKRKPVTKLMKFLSKVKVRVQLLDGASFFFIFVAEIAAEAVEGEALEDGDMQEEDESK